MLGVVAHNTDLLDGLLAVAGGLDIDPDIDPVAVLIIISECAGNGLEVQGDSEAVVKSAFNEADLGAVDGMADGNKKVFKVDMYGALAGKES